MTNVLRRPIHPEPGNANMAMAARLASLFALGTTNKQPWITEYSAATFIQGETLQIPWRTRAEAATNKPTADGGANPQKPKPGTGIEEGDPSLDGGTEGDDISLTSETGEAMANGQTLNSDTSLKLTMVVYQRDPRVASEVQGAKNSYTVDVGDTLHAFDTAHKKHGVEEALRELFKFPCAEFGLPLDGVMQQIKDSVMPPSEIAKRLEALPGVKK